jgi:hypothetical protein
MLSRNIEYSPQKKQGGLSVLPSFLSAAHVVVLTSGILVVQARQQGHKRVHQKHSARYGCEFAPSACLG